MPFVVSSTSNLQNSDGQTVLCAPFSNTRVSGLNTLPRFGSPLGLFGHSVHGMSVAISTDSNQLSARQSPRFTLVDQSSCTREGLLSFQLNMIPMAIKVPKRDERFDFYLSETRMDQMLSAEESRAKLLRENKRSFPPPHVRICPSGYWV